MTVFSKVALEGRLTNADHPVNLLPSGNEAGTSPEDRPFRPDVQGLRAIAVLLVVLFHAGVPWISGGYVGVDVFFVISGFVITGVLLRERTAKGSTSLRRFYARRARRILPAATLVIIVTVVAAFHLLGPLIGHETAVDGQWAAVFLANIHFAASQTNYLASQQPPSALQNYWSLAVEEQFYLVYPAIFLVAASVFRRSDLRLRLAAVLVVIIISSYAYSITLTSSNAANAFFSPLTRAWELALGGLIAIAGHKLSRTPKVLAALLSWIGLAVIVLTGVTLTSATVYPGALVALPVAGAAFVIAGGAAEPAWGVERLLRLRPVQVLGLLSYSLYLWHWPILVVAAEYRGTNNLPVWDNVLLVLVAAVAAAATYRVLENPVRHAKVLIGRPAASIAVGLCLVGGTLTVATVEARRPTVNLGSLTTAATGSSCIPPQHVVSQLQSSYSTAHHHALQPVGVANQSVVVIGDSTACTLLPGLAAVGGTYGLQFHSGAVVGCGVVSGQLAPDYLGPVNLTAYTARCQAEANHDESAAIERYEPRIVLWGSTDEHSSFVVHGTKGRILVTGSSQWRTVMMRRITERINSLLATGAKVILLLEPAAVHQSLGVDSDDVAYGRMNTMLREVAAQHPETVGLVDLQPRVCSAKSSCPYVVPGFDPPLSRGGQRFACGATLVSSVPCDQTLRPDGLHYTAAGSLWVAEWLVPRISAVATHLLSRR